MLTDTPRWSHPRGNTVVPYPWQATRPSRQTIYDRLDEAIEDLRTRYGGLPSPEAIRDELWHQEAHSGRLLLNLRAQTTDAAPTRASMQIA